MKHEESCKLGGNESHYGASSQIFAIKSNSTGPSAKTPAPDHYDTPASK